MEKLSPRNDVCESKDYLIDEDALDLDYSEKFPLPKVNLRNKTIMNASDKIEIKFNSTFGRHIVAVEDIDIGTFLYYLLIYFRS